ncbi:MAG TPA: PDZ domain-containing protein [Polyangiaceae bacterium]
MIALALACVLFGCAREPLPQLISLSDLLPREVEVGDKLEVSGSGLPQGRTARVTFRGDLHRAGEPVIRRAEIVADGEVTAADRLEIQTTEGLQADFCGAGNDAVHTTFEGAVEVAFAPTLVGAPPVAATLPHVTLDFRPPLPATSSRAREGERLVAFAGIHLVESESRGSGLGVASVDEGSRAEGAGFQDGDEITTFDGVRVLSVADIAAIEGEPVADVVVHRVGREEHLKLHLEGFRPAPTADRFAAVVLLVLFAFALLVRSTPVSTRLGVLARRLRARGSALATAPFAGWAKKRGVFVSAIALSIALVAVPCAVEALPTHTDAPTVFGAVALASVVIAAFARGLVSALRVFAWQIAAACAVAGSVVISGSLRVGEIASTQGGGPWNWIAFRGPAGLALVVAYLVAMLGSTLEEPKGDDVIAQLEAREPVAALDTSDALRLALAASLAVPLFFGGGGRGATHGSPLVISFALAASLFWLVASLRSVVPGLWRLRTLVPAAGFALVLAFAQNALRFDHRIETILDLATLAVVVLAAVHLLTIVRALGKKGTVVLRPSPFL